MLGEVIYKKTKCDFIILFKHPIPLVNHITW